MDKKNFITFSDALKSRAPAAFSSMVKPVGSMCNLNCTYCYYLDKAPTIYDNHQGLMSEAVLERYIGQYITLNQSPEILFVWHGGEPLMAGLDFYRKVIKLQNTHASGKKIVNTLQTNGVLLNDEWCNFFQRNKFLIGVSIDGPKDLHDAYRRSKNGNPTFDRVMAAINMMNHYGVEYNTLTVISNLSENRGTEVYRFLKSIGSRYMQFLPVVEYCVRDQRYANPIIAKPGTVDSSLSPWSVSAKGYGKFMTDVFDEWVINDVGSYFVQSFDATLAQYVGVKPGLCTFSETCGDALVVEYNGDVYSCDHFVYPDYKLGNIMETDLLRLFLSPRQFKFGIDKRNLLPRECLRCSYYFACRGQCPKHRFLNTEHRDTGLNFLCEGLKHYFSHVEPYMHYMRDLLLQRKSPSLIMSWARIRMNKGNFSSMKT